MPRYVFDIHDGGARRDETGTACADLEAVRRQALRTRPDIARDEIPQDGDRRTFTVPVTDEDAHPVYSATPTDAGLWPLR